MSKTNYDYLLAGWIFINDTHQINLIRDQLLAKEFIDYNFVCLDLQVIFVISHGQVLQEEENNEKN